VGLVIALKEEFRELQAEVGPGWLCEDDPDTGNPYYRFDRAGAAGAAYGCVAACVGGMGEGKAGRLTERLLARWQPATVAVLGIAAGISDDVRVGDVVVATQVDSYFESAKATAGEGPHGFDFKLGGENYRPSYDLIQAASHLEFRHPEGFGRWQETGREELRGSVPQRLLGRLVKDGVLRAAPAVHEGHLASGPAVAAAAAFNRWLKDKRDRKLLAVEMESGGILAAVYERTDPAHSLVLRGISDYGDERKQQLDQVKEGVLRRYAMRNAVRFLWRLLEVGSLPRRSGTPPSPGAAGPGAAPAGAGAEGEYDLAEVRKLIKEALSAGDLETFCFDYFREVYDEFTSGQFNGDRVLLLVTHAHRKRQLERLLDELRKANPRVSEEFAGRLRRGGGAAVTP
jgi:nucleoside phosphorylase